MDLYQKNDLYALRSAPKYRSYLASFFAPHVGGKDVLEIGAGIGDLAREIIKFEPKSLMLLEPNPECGDEIQELKKQGFQVSTLRSNELAEDSSRVFDTIIYSNVLEHIEDDPAELLVSHSLLRPGGHVLIIVPAMSFLYSEVDRRLQHFRRYSRDGFINMVEGLGVFEIEECRYINCLGIPGWLLNKLRANSTQSPTLFRIFDSFVLPVSRSLDPIISRVAGLSIFAVLKRSST